MSETSESSRDRSTGAESASGRAKRRGPLRLIGVVLSAALLLFVAVVAVLVIVLPVSTGSTPYTVLTSSMEPDFPPGSLVVIRPTDADAVKVGDIVTYQLKSGQPEVVTHRVIQVVQTPGEETTFITQGDNNDVADSEPVRPVQIKGTLWYSVPLIGWVNNVVNGDARAIVIPIVAVGLFVYAGWMFVSGMLGRARRRKADAALAAG